MREEIYFRPKRISIDDYKEGTGLLYNELRTTFSPDEEDILLLPPPTRKEKMMSLCSIFIPTKGFFITPLLIDINIIVFILMVIGGANFMMPDNDSLLNWGANLRPATLDGEPWRLITACFIHIGVIHLLMNMYALLFIGILLEPMLGKARFLSAYLLSGIVASINSMYIHDLTISAGASGAIFGMYGVFFALLTTNFIERSARTPLLTSIAIFIGYNLLSGMKAGIDNAAHIGGLIAGLILGYSFLPSLKRNEDSGLKFGIIAAATFFVLATSFVVYKTTPNDIAEYNVAMKKFEAMEKAALEVYQLSPNTPVKSAVYQIRDRGIFYWVQCLRLLDNFDKLNLPLSLRARNRILKEYCKLRISSYELILRSVTENTNRYARQIDEYNQRIQEKIDEISKQE